MKLPQDSKVIKFYQCGAPQDVLKVETEPVGQLGDGDILIEILAAPIHPADINFIEGTYGIKPHFPAVPGNEGAGVVKAVGEKVTRFKVGDNVRPPEGVGTWRQCLRAEAEKCLKLPSEILPEQLAMIYVNPPTAWRMLNDFVELHPGDWLIQNAANSAVGRSVIQIAKNLNWKTINLVRRPELVDELKKLGGDVVLLDNARVKEKVSDVVQEPIKLALNAVGGDSATRLADCLTKSGTMVTYGAMSKQALKIPNSFLIFKDIQLRGFWMSRWYQQHESAAKEFMLEKIGSLMRENKLTLKIDQTFPLEKIAEAVALAQQSSRDGKVLLKMS